MAWKLLLLSSILLVAAFLFITNKKLFVFHHDNDMKSSDKIITVQEEKEETMMATFTKNNIDINDCNNRDIKMIPEIRNHLSNMIFNQLELVKLQRTNKEEEVANDYAYVTIIHETNSITNETASGWCKNMRATHSSYSNFDIVALFSSSSSRNSMIHAAKYECFDKLLYVDKKVNDFLSNYTSNIDSSVISKLWMFSLVQYKRVIFMKSLDTV